MNRFADESDSRPVTQAVFSKTAAMARQRFSFENRTNGCLTGYQSVEQNLEPILLHKLAIAAFTAIFFTGAAVADTQPNAQERATIEIALKNAGFTSWEEIELDDGRWEVDDAVHQDGGKYDLELDPNSYAIIKRERDD
jgi:hypothetical protein